MRRAAELHGKWSYDYPEDIRSLIRSNLIKSLANDRSASLPTLINLLTSLHLLLYEYWNKKVEENELVSQFIFNSFIRSFNSFHEKMILSSVSAPVNSLTKEKETQEFFSKFAKFFAL
jgi:hypothetical protein